MKDSYTQARALLEKRDLESLIDLAADEACFPEMLYYLSSDDNTEIRTKVAANPSTPMQADKILVGDKEALVREALGGKVAKTLSNTPDEENPQRSAAIAILAQLVEDEEVRVRRIIAQELQTTDKIPLKIIQKLARDFDELVSTPILHNSPILDDEELIAIIQESATTSQLKAIAERAQVSEPLAECIVETADVEAISQLLLNSSAQIRENTLDQLIDGARDIPEWHEPLVIRPKLPFGAIRKIAGFVAGPLLEVLAQRSEIDDSLREELENRIQQRLAEDNSPDQTISPEPLDALEHKLRMLHSMGDLNIAFLNENIDQGERNSIILSLAILADIPKIVARRIFVSLNSKAIMSLAWKAGIPAMLATKIQGTVAKIPNQSWIHPNDEGEYPFSTSEMEWQLELFLEEEASALSPQETGVEMSDV